MKLFWYKVLVHWKLIKITQFPNHGDSSLILLGNNGIRVMKKRLVSVKQGSKMTNFGTPLPKFSLRVPPLATMHLCVVFRKYHEFLRISQAGSLRELFSSATVQSEKIKLPLNAHYSLCLQ